METKQDSSFDNFSLALPSLPLSIHAFVLISLSKQKLLQFFFLWLTNILLLASLKFIPKYLNSKHSLQQKKSVYLVFWPYLPKAF